MESPQNPRCWNERGIRMSREASFKDLSRRFGRKGQYKQSPEHRLRPQQDFVQNFPRPQQFPRLFLHGAAHGPWLPL